MEEIIRGHNMKCLSCDVILTDFEATRKSAYSGQYIDLCNRCFSSVKDQVLVVERYDLLHEESDDEKTLDRYDET